MSKQNRQTIRRLGVAALALIALGVGGVVATSSAAGDRGADFVVFEPEAGGTATYFDLGQGAADADPLSDIGDMGLEHKPLIEPGSGAPAGHAVTRLQVIDVVGGDPLFNIDCTIELHGGDIVFYGAGRFSELGDGAVFAVTGGTRRYTGARGTVTVRAAERQGAPGFTIDFDLIKGGNNHD